MTSRTARGKRPERRFTVEGVRREQPDMRKLGKALLAVVLADRQHQAEDEAAETRDAT
ncbi:hypothetical protein [Streptomyces prunicolor]|uniref:Uncharacterized protein n=1 Tax=Streptomyces prunicolor TaxID=67348 RepID=A0ABU4FIS6_9ACTN|nr:hypothetical protein [Streptomyces prunicolor]MDV7219155.1 hypothetical protein [Streptomyces prunicolor]